MGTNECTNRRAARKSSSSPEERTSMKASDLFVKALEAEGVRCVFGLPGEENLDLLESLRASGIRFVVTRHEQAAGFMAATLGRLTGTRGRVPRDARAGRDQPRHRGGVRPARRHAHGDDHRAEAHQGQQAGPLPDRRRRRDDAAAHQVHAHARLRGAHPARRCARPSAAPRRSAPAPRTWSCPRTSRARPPTPRRSAPSCPPPARGRRGVHRAGGRRASRRRGGRC